MHRNDQDQLEGIGILVGLPGQLRDRFVSALTSMCLRVPACSDTAWLPDVSQAASLRLIILGDSPGRAEEQCRAVRLQRIRAPIIVLQPARSIERKNCLLAAGADRVLTTEPHGRVVVHARRLLDESLRVFTEPIRHGPFMCDVRRNLATAMGERLELFPTERLLLASLIREPGIIVPWRDLTFDVLRRPPDEATQKALYHCFWRTKQKVGRLGKWLRAHRGIGYEAHVCDTIRDDALEPPPRSRLGLNLGRRGSGVKQAVLHHEQPPLGGRRREVRSGRRSWEEPSSFE